MNSNVTSLPPRAVMGIKWEKVYETPKCLEYSDGPRLTVVQLTMFWLDDGVKTIHIQ